MDFLMRTVAPADERQSSPSDVMLIIGLIVIFMMMIVPVPPFLLDFFYTINIALCLVILVSTMHIPEPLGFTMLPSLVLIITLFRLALNVSGSRSVLLNGYAGDVVDAFGQLVVGGDYVVGIIVFLILVVIQFVVITTGAQRVAEVAARFTLDAMPGKQMSIDADLNSGTITQEEAKQRRREIEREADFYGAMDGAGKFIRGDAIAAVIIIIVNVTGGFIIGVVQKGLPLDLAIQKYTILTIGEGLATQIPALLISTATGLVVTRAAPDFSMGRDTEKQVFGTPQTISIVSVILLVLGLVPGLPKIPFLALAAVLYLIYRNVTARKARQKIESMKEAEPPKVEPPEEMYGHLQIEPIEVELGYSLVELINVEKGGDLLKRIVMLRRSFATDLGLVVPPVRIRDNITLSPDSYAIRIFDQVAGKGELMPGKFLVLGADLENARRQMEVIETREPAFGLPALWVGERDREKAEILGYTVIDCPSVLATHISEVIKSRAADILTRQDVQSLVDNLKAAAPVVVSELIPSLMKIGEVQKVLQNLLKEGVSIKNLRLILETLGDHAPCSKEICYLTNQVRIALARSICDEYRLTGNVMPVITLSPRVESIILGALAESTQNDYFGLLGPDLLRSLYTNLTRAVQRATAAGYQPVIVCSGSVRMPFRNLTERAVKKIVVLSFNEIVDDCSLEVLEVVDVDDSAIEGCEREIKAACA